MSISVVIICRNEEKTIRSCLRSVAGWVDEIVAVDAQSTDATVALCREFTDRVWVREWAGFGPQRNFALEQAQGDWILVLDADEVVPPALAAEIQEAVRQDGPIAYRMPRRSWFCGRFLQWGGNYPDYVLRLFRRGRAHYSDRHVHESLIFDETTGPPPIGTLHEALLHYTYPTLEHYLGKLGHYSRLNALQLQREGQRWQGRKMLTGPVSAFISRFVLKRGYRDGWQGFLYAALSAIAVFCKYALLWDLERREQHEAARLASEHGPAAMTAAMTNATTNDHETRIEG